MNPHAAESIIESLGVKLRKAWLELEIVQAERDIACAEVARLRETMRKLETERDALATAAHGSGMVTGDATEKAD
jgi:hypothetical protein